jgi:hypothetical protein
MALLDWLACAWARKIVPFMVWTALSTVILFSFIILYFDIIYKGSAFSL